MNDVCEHLDGSEVCFRQTEASAAASVQYCWSGGLVAIAAASPCPMSGGEHAGVVLAT
jgi:hypothetical protein